MRLREIASAFALSSSYATFGAVDEAPAPVSISAQNYEARQLALEAVRISYPAEAARRDSVQNFEVQFRASFGKNPQNAALEKRYPGITDAMAASGSAEMAALLAEIEPKLLSAVAADLASRIALADIIAMIDFYKSPAGQALLSLDPQLMDKQTGLIPISSLSLQNREAIGLYQSSQAGQRIAIATQKSLATIPETAARLMEPLQPRVNAKLQAAASAFIAKGKR
jgi:hypothetical protein